MEWNAQKYQQTCGRVTEHGAKLVDVLRKMKCGKVLDIGCGTGVLTHEIAEFANEVIGIDSSASMINKAKTSYPEIEFLLIDACNMQWENYFDVVFSNAVFHFIKEQDILLDNIHKVLTQNGVLVCEFGAYGNITGLLNAVEKACINRHKEYSLRFYYPAEEEYKNLLEKHGFFVESIFTYGLDTALTEGELGLRNWINQVFSVEMAWFDDSEREAVLNEIETEVKPTQWDGSNWHLPNRRLQFIARKI
jgi:trans-aconitate methyltransferase